ncbi:MAG: DUF4926 domain-containing protein [bacterium]|nr:DUF4926 domain-containing protein [bacterium]
MEIELYKRVVINRTIPESNVYAGDVAWLLDFVPHPSDDEDGCVLEIFNALGDSIAVVVVPRSAISPLRQDQVLSVRTLQKA